LSSPLGQYRPGGTSSYSGVDSKTHVEVAARPSSPASSNSSTSTTSPLRTSDPWAPPTTTPSQRGTRAY
jgi:hypothetical protein